MTLTDAGTRYCFWRLAWFLHCEALAGPPGEDCYLVVCQARRRAQVEKYVRWLQRHAWPDGCAWERRGENN